MNKVLVTGATGFIGNYVVEELLRRGIHVIASSASPVKARNTRWFDQVEYRQLDFQQLDNEVNYFDYFGSPDRMIHLAWEGLPNYKATFHIDINLPRHFEFLSGLIKNGLKDLTVTGTCFEYGMQEGELKESMDTHPGNPYSLAKDQLRRKLEGFSNNYPFDLKWIRLFYMYGKGQNPKSILAQLETALQNGDRVFNMSGGEQTRDYLPIEKVAAYIVTIAMQDRVKGIINCCSGVPITIKKLVRDYLSSRGAEMDLNLGFYPYPDYEPMHFWGNNEKLKSILSHE